MKWPLGVIPLIVVVAWGMSPPATTAQPNVILNTSNVPPVFHGFRAYHHKKDPIYRALKEEPAGE